MSDFIAPPRDKILEVITWLRGEVYPGLVGHPLDDEGIAAWVCDRYIALWNTLVQPDSEAKHQQAKHLIFGEIERVVHPAPAPPPQPVTPARTGRVRLDNRCFVDEQGPFCAAIFTDMSALRLFEQDRNRHDQNCSGMKARGADARRILGMVSWPGRQIDPRRGDYTDWLIASIDAAYDLGLRTELTMFADCRELGIGMQERRDHARRVARALRGREHKLLFVEGCNEPGHPVNGPWTPDELLEIGQIVKSELDVLYACGAPFGGPNAATEWTDDVYHRLAQADLVTPHFDRDTGKHDGMYRPIRQCIEGQNYGHPYVNNEPIGPGASVASENSPGRLRAAATFTWIARGAGYVYHTKAGIGSESDALIEQQPGADVVFDSKRILDGDTPAFGFSNWHWDSNPWITLDGSLGDHDVNSRGSLRTISGTNGGRFHTQVLRVTAGVTLRARFGMEFDVWHGGEDGPYRQIDHRRVNTGETFDVSTAVDVLLKGRFT